MTIYRFLEKQLCVDFLNLQSGEELTMAIFHLIALTSFFLEHKDFFRLSLLGYLGNDLGIFQNGAADLRVVTIHNHQDIIQFNDISDIAIDLLNSQLISTSYLILLSTGTYYCIHNQFLFGKNLNISPFMTTRNGLKDTFSRGMSIFLSRFVGLSEMIWVRADDLSGCSDAYCGGLWRLADMAVNLGGGGAVAGGLRKDVSQRETAIKPSPFSGSFRLS